MLTHTRIVLALALVWTMGLGSAKAETPQFAFETTLPGFFLPKGNEVVVDESGNSYVIGSAYEDQIGLDLLVFKVDPEGVLLWSQFIVGETHDQGEGLLLDDDDNLWVIGWTDSEDFPSTPDALHSTKVGARDVFLTRFDGDDGSILYSTFLGGTYVDEGHAITRDAAGNLVIVGATRSRDFPTVDPYQDGPTTFGYVRDLFVAKLNPAGTEILYSTYFGGSKKDQAIAVAIDPDGNIVLAGGTDSDDFPLQDPIQSGAKEIFVSKFSADGSELLFSTYFGGEDIDRLWDMALDTEGFVYLTGSTRSAFLPTTPGAFQTEFAGEIDGCGSPPFEPLRNCEDGFVTKIPTDGGWFVYSTYLGGNSIDECHDISVDPTGAVRVTGYTASSNFPGSENDDRFFISKLNAAGSALDYTIQRYTANGGGFGITTVGTDEVYVTGVTEFPAEAYVAKLQEETPASTPGTNVLGSPGLVLSTTPNPFTSSTQLAYQIPGSEPAPTFLGVFDVHGRLVRTLVSADQTAGSHVVAWDGTDLDGQPVPTGVYSYLLEVSGEKSTGRVLRIR